MPSESSWDYDSRAKTYRPPNALQAHSHASTDLPSAGVVPVGAIMAYYGTTAPTNWLICDGSSFSAATYPALNTLLGGTTLPNLKGKVVAGVDAAQTEFAALGTAGGLKTMTTNKMPSHSHSHNHGSHTHSHNHGSHTHSHDHGLTNHNHGGGTGVHSHTFGGGVWGIGTSSHAHYIGGSAGEASAAPQGGTRAGSAADLNNAGVANTTQGSNDATGATPTTDATGATPTTDATTAGTGAAGGNLPPYISINYIIRAA